MPRRARPPRCASRRREGRGAARRCSTSHGPALLPEGPPLYPGDELTDRSLRFLAAELVREAAFEALAQELPYALAVEVVEFDESRPDLVRIRADLLVERASQKQIVIGTGRRGDQAHRDPARAARSSHCSDRKVHLALWVKVEPKWSQAVPSV